jgi:hypothetical protein
MKKSTFAVAALLTALSSAPLMSVAYADDAAPAPAATDAKKCCQGCKGCDKAADAAAPAATDAKTE